MYDGELKHRQATIATSQDRLLGNIRKDGYIHPLGLVVNPSL